MTDFLQRDGNDSRKYTLHGNDKHFRRFVFISPCVKTMEKDKQKLVS